MQEYTQSPTAALPSEVPSCRSLSSSEDGPRGHSSLSDAALARRLQDSIKHRLLYLSEQLRLEKASRDENAMCYLKLVSQAGRRRAPHIRQAFEKVNQRTSATIAQIERRLRQCHQQLQEVEEGCRPKGLVLRAGSSLDTCEQPSTKALVSEPPQPGGEDRLSTCPSDVIRSFPRDGPFPAPQRGRSSESTRVAQRQRLLWRKMKEELEEVGKVHLRLRVSYESLREQHLTDLQVALEALQEEKCRRALAEGQVNEHLQGHLDEIYLLKQNLACAEEKMAYLSYERAKEIWEVMETFKSRISKLETLQQVTHLEVPGTVWDRPQELTFWFASLLLALAAVLLVLVSAVCACPLPLENSHLCACAGLMLLGLGALAWQKRHAIPSVDWQAWVPARWRLGSKDSRPLSDGP
ncbi:testis-specific protein TEX28 [Phacochoerus africanus]|uniref:testis-specific protein TEX28 n=1 Tax=Phacochoerus africanus TaxID=41426 RepID=UPI001FDA9EFF|nr:testis-specific protein TEX28 [Phacochoerus africanus]